MTIESPGVPSRSLQSVQMLRAAAALSVLLYHLVNTSAFGWMESSDKLPQPALFFSQVGFAGVDLFFVISGVVMVLTCYDRLGQPHEAAPFLKRRIARIYPLYWACTIAVLALSWLWPELASREKSSLTTIAKSLLLWPQDEFPIVAVGWTLSYEMYFYLVFAMLLMLPRRWLLPALGLWAAATIAVFPLYDRPAYRVTPDGHLSLPLFASPLTLEFIVGCIIGWLAHQRSTPWAGAALLLGLAAFTAGGGYVAVNYPLDAQYGLVRAVIFGGASALIVYGAIGLEQRGVLSIPPWVAFWGDASYSTYLTHMYALWFVAAIWRASAPKVPAHAWIATLVGVAACAATAAASHLAIERPLTRLAARILSPSAVRNLQPPSAA